MEARRLHQIDFVKVDVEGAELLVVRGFLKSLHRFKPILMLEVSPRWSKDFGYQPAELLTTLQEAGYDRFDEVAENGRLTMMFCSFEANPLIVRLYGTGKVVHPRDAAWNELRPLFPEIPGVRQIILLDIESIMTTCGFAVPLYDYRGDRHQLEEFTCKMGDERMDEYRHQKNQVSIDGLPTYLFEAQPTA